jgi:hypothetical protein
MDRVGGPADTVIVADEVAATAAVMYAGVTAGHLRTRRRSQERASSGSTSQQKTVAPSPIRKYVSGESRTIRMLTGDGGMGISDDRRRTGADPC